MSHTEHCFVNFDLIIKTNSQHFITKLQFLILFDQFHFFCNLIIMSFHSFIFKSHEGYFCGKNVLNLKSYYKFLIDPKNDSDVFGLLPTKLHLNDLKLLLSKVVRINELIFPNSHFWISN